MKNRTSVDNKMTLPATSSWRAAKAVARKGRKKRRSVTAAAVAVAAAATSSSLLPSCQSLTTSPHFRAKKKAKRPQSSSRESPPKKGKSSESSSSSSQERRTQSFGPRWAGSVLFGDVDPSDYPSIHTLVLHPSVTSLELGQNYAHPQNAFWWIAGDCLGFRRAVGVKADGKTPFALAQHLRYGPDKILPTYEEQERIFVSHGFALWDVVGSCVRPGSLDADIKMEQPNDIRGFVEQHAPDLKRIVFANGGTTCALFCKNFKDWWMEDGSSSSSSPTTAEGTTRRRRPLVPGSNPESMKAFGKLDSKRNKANNSNSGGITTPSSSSSSFCTEAAPIECISAISVSPAAAKYTYLEKRNFWEANVYQPGLRDYKERQQ